MTLYIKPDSKRFRKTKTFRHAGDLAIRYDSVDPRDANFQADIVVVDLRECNFVYSAAALWCVVFIALAVRRRSRCRLLVPTNTAVCVHLKSLGLFETVRELDAEVDDRDIHAGTGAKVILPISCFRTTAEATELANAAFERLQAAGLGAVNLTPVVTEMFSELVLNAAQHSESPVGAFSCIQFIDTPRGQRFSCTIADGGIGIRQSLLRNESLRTRVSYDWDALELAVRERVSGTGDPHRGIGLYGVSEEVRSPGRSLLLHSGQGSLEITEELEISARRTRLFPGTLAYLSIPA